MELKLGWNEMDKENFWIVGDFKKDLYGEKFFCLKCSGRW